MKDLSRNEPSPVSSNNAIENLEEFVSIYSKEVLYCVGIFMSSSLMIEIFLLRFHLTLMVLNAYVSKLFMGRVVCL